MSHREKQQMKHWDSCTTCLLMSLLFHLRGPYETCWHCSTKQQGMIISQWPNVLILTLQRNTSSSNLSWLLLHIFVKLLGRSSSHRSEVCWWWSSILMIHLCMAIQVMLSKCYHRVWRLLGSGWERMRFGSILARLSGYRFCLTTLQSRTSFSSATAALWLCV